MKIIIGTEGTFKSTISFHYTYNELTKLQLLETPEQQQDPDYHQACYITSKKRMIDNNFMFGTYCEVSIDIL